MTNTVNTFDSDLIECEIDGDPGHEVVEHNRLKPLVDLCLNLNHDVNNPLTGILGYAEFLLMSETNLTVDQRTDLKQIVTCAERIQVLMGNLMSKLNETESALVRDWSVPRIRR